MKRGFVLFIKRDSKMGKSLKFIAEFLTSNCVLLADRDTWYLRGAKHWNTYLDYLDGMRRVTNLGLGAPVSATKVYS